MKFSWKRVIHIVIREYMIDVISDQLMQVHSLFFFRMIDHKTRDPHDLVIDSEQAKFPPIEKRKTYLPKFMHKYLEEGSG